MKRQNIPLPIPKHTSNECKASIKWQAKVQRERERIFSSYRCKVKQPDALKHIGMTYFEMEMYLQVQSSTTWCPKTYWNDIFWNGNVFTGASKDVSRIQEAFYIEEWGHQAMAFFQKSQSIARGKTMQRQTCTCWWLFALLTCLLITVCSPLFTTLLYGLIASVILSLYANYVTSQLLAVRERERQYTGKYDWY